MRIFVIARRFFPEQYKSTRRSGSGLAGGYAVLFSRLRRGRAGRRSGWHGNGGPTFPEDAATGDYEHRATAGAAAQDSRSHYGRPLRRLSNRSAHGRGPVLQIRIPFTRALAGEDLLQIWRFQHRHHARQQSLCAHVPHRQSGVRDQSSDLAGRRNQIRRHHSARMHQLRARGHQRICQLQRLHLPLIHAGQSPRSGAAAQMHRASGRIEI